MIRSSPRLKICQEGSWYDINGAHTSLTSLCVEGASAGFDGGSRGIGLEVLGLGLGSEAGSCGLGSGGAGFGGREFASGLGGINGRALSYVPHNQQQRNRCQRPTRVPQAFAA
jgi:hypothetical protein